MSASVETAQEAHESKPIVQSFEIGEPAVEAPMENKRRRMDEPEGGIDEDSFYDFVDDDDDDYSPEIAHNNSQAYSDCMRKGPSNVGVLKDEWTPAGQQPPNCTFPFSYRGKIYYACIDPDYGGQFWCANSCDYSQGELFHRGECNIPRNTRGVLGTGVALNTLNVFVGLMFAVGFTVMFLLCLVELRRRRYEKTSSIDEERTGLHDSVELGNGMHDRQVAPS